MTATASGVYFLECSEDLAAWKRIGDVQVTKPGPISFRDARDPGGTVPHRASMFYRVATQSDALDE
jgi:hypothetical protein